MSATTGDKVGWIVAFALTIAMVIFVLWPRKRPAGGSSSNTTTPPAQQGGQQVAPDGVPLGGSLVDANGAPRQTVGAQGLDAASDPNELLRPAIRLQAIHNPGPVII